MGGRGRVLGGTAVARRIVARRVSVVRQVVRVAIACRAGVMRSAVVVRWVVTGRVIRRGVAVVRRIVVGQLITAVAIALPISRARQVAIAPLPVRARLKRPDHPVKLTKGQPEGSGASVALPDAEHGYGAVGVPAQPHASGFSPDVEEDLALARQRNGIRLGHGAYRRPGHRTPRSSCRTARPSLEPVPATGER